MSTEAAPGARPIEPVEPTVEPEGITLDLVQDDPELSSFITAADRVMEGLGYTSTGSDTPTSPRGSRTTSCRVPGSTSTRRTSRAWRATSTTSATWSAGTRTGRPALVYQSPKDRVPAADLALIVSAIANHEEDNGYAVSPVSAAVILADKSDVHRSRVRKSADRVRHPRPRELRGRTVVPARGPAARP